MRKINTFILRMITDTNQPENLRGVLFTISNQEKITFTDEASLLVALKSFILTSTSLSSHPASEGNAKPGEKS